MYLAAGRALERAAGQKWEKLVRARICDPLGMTGVTFTTTAIPRDADRAGGHRLGKSGKVELMPAYEITEPNPSGSVNATAKDLAAWLKFHLANGVGPDGKRMVSVKNFAETHTPQNVIRLDGVAKALNPDTVQLCYAMGWIVSDHRGKKVLSHGGMIDGFRVQVTFLPGENLGFAVLVNLHDTRMPAALTNSLIDLYCGLPAKDWNGYFRKVTDDEAADRAAALRARDKARNPDGKPALPPAGYAGEYEHAAYGKATVTADDGKLTLNWSSFRCPLDHFEGDTYRVTGGQFEEQLVVFGVTGGTAATVRFAGQDFSRK
jgi:CubicO group peptidase (beta-lactamase class C family)